MYLVRLAMLCIDMVNDFLTKNCPYVAGAIAFYSLFSMFPLVLAIISVWGFFLGGESDRAALAAQVSQVIPVSTDFIGENMESVARGKPITSAAAFLGLLWASCAVFGAIRKGINNAWGITKPKPFLRERLIDFGLMAGAGLLMPSLLYVAPMIGRLERLVKFVFPAVEFELVARVISEAASPLIGFAVFLVLYKYMPNTKVSFGDVWLGALAASLAFNVAKWGFLLYLDTFPVYNVLYGGVGVIIALLTWVYVSALILLFGALATSWLTRFRREADSEAHILKLMWMGLSRVRLKAVDASEIAA